MTHWLERAGTRRPVIWLVFVLAALSYGGVFGILVTRQPHDRVAWIFGAIALLASVSSVLRGRAPGLTSRIAAPGPFD
jgi:hypothetical protein